MVAHNSFDKPAEQPIVEKNQPRRTPSEGAVNTDRGLTGHADEGSMAAERNIIPELSSRQSPSAAVDGFSVGAVEYCQPAKETIAGFVQAVMSELDGLPDTEIRQGFRQFIDVLISIQTKAANNRGGSDDEAEGKAQC
jgi:hypothetical protein